MNVEQRLRSALRDGATRLEMPGPGPGAAGRRARQRGRRLHALSVSSVVVVLVGGLLSVWGGAFRPDPTVVMDGGVGDAATEPGPDEPGPDGPGSGEPGPDEAATLDLRWQDAEGLVGHARETLRASDGTYYALSTAPGTRFADYPSGDVPQALYRSDDGLDWEVAPLGDEPWVAGLGERDGVLYALSTAPGTSGGSGRIGLSGDGGETWQRADLPSSASPPAATVRLGGAQVTGHLAVAEDAVVAAVRTRYPVDLASLAAAGERADGHFWQSTPEGFVLYEALEVAPPGLSDPGAPVSGGAVVQDEAVPDPGDRPSGGQPAPGQPLPETPVRTVTWADMGLGGPDDLVVDELFVSRDGGDWEAVPSPFDGRALADLAATPDGFVAVLNTQDMRLGSPVELLRSSDGVAWEPLASDETLASAGPLQAFAVLDGQRMVAVAYPDAESPTVLSSRDGGRSWSVADLPALEPGRHDAHTAVTHLDASPLGAAVAVVAVGAGEGARAEFFVLTSPDADTWTATPLADIVGDGARARVAWLTVGPDSIALGATWPPPSDGSPVPARTFVGTPVR